MAVLKCKMCGGDLEIIEGSTILVCQYCDTKQTVPLIDNDKKLTLFSRANRLRFNCEFDKSYSVYESIVADFPEEAEAYWGLVLCKYGVEYVDDPKTAKKIPTCHRSSFDSVLDGTNYEQALENASVDARAIYREEAKQIEELRRSIIEISSKEDPYDIFICYKETDIKGNRTIDSVIAQDTYELLTRKGYRVFFSRISLEDKLGREYEPYIFSALHSARIMLVFGTDYEHFNAVWVKNEWSRFLKLMEKDEEKALIPCFKGIDAYDMPKEFAHLQGQDMGKVGAMQDLLRGIEKILSADKKEEKIIFQASDLGVMLAPLLRRAKAYLKNRDFENATEYFDKVLDFSPENEDALLGKLLSEYEVIDLEELSKTTEVFNTSSSYTYLITFCSDELKNKLNIILDKVKENILKEAELCLKIHDFFVANQYCNRALDYDSKNERALLFKLLIRYEVSGIDELSAGIMVFTDSEEYESLISVCSQDIKAQLDGAQEKIKENIVSEMKRYVKLRHFAKAQDCYNQYIKLGIYDNDDVLLNKLFADLRVSDFKEIEIKQLSFTGLPSYISIYKHGSKELKASLLELIDKINTQRAEAMRLAKIKKYVTLATVSIIIAICIVIGIIISNSPSTIYECSIINDNEIAVIDINKPHKAIKDGHLTIPDKIKGRNVTRVSSLNLPSGYDKSDITSVTLPDTLTEIGGFAFYNYDKLLSVNIPSGVTKIGTYAFSGCSSLAKIDLPKNLISIESFAFANCSSLKSIQIPFTVDKIGEYAFKNDKSLTIYCEAMVVQGSWDYYWNSAACPVVWNYLNSGRLENGLSWKLTSSQKVEIIAYEGNEENVVIPEKIDGYYVTKISENAFNACKYLKSITIPNSVTVIDTDAFRECEALSKVTLSSEIKKLGDRVFLGCTSLTEIELPEGIENIGESAFKYCTSLKQITIPSSITDLSSSLFHGCNSLTSVEASQIDVINQSAFYNCTALESFNALSVRIIEKNAFYCCSSLKEMSLNGTTTIGDRAFYECTAIKKIVIPKSVITVGESIFFNCNNLTVCCELELRPSGWHRDWDKDNCTVIWGGLEEGTTNDGIKWKLSTDYLVKIVGYSGTGENVVIPDNINGYSVVEISDMAFSGENMITSVELPAGIGKIGSSAFENCTELKSINIPMIEIISPRAFYNCRALESIIIPSSVSQIEKEAFWNCAGLKTVTLNEGLTSIGVYSFKSCTSLKTVNIPTSVEKISMYAFENCKSLEKITIPKEVATISSGAFSGCSLLTIYCEAQKKPSGWDENWNNYNYPVVWGHKEN